MGAATPEAAPDRREPESRPTVESRPIRERSTSSSKPAEDLGTRRGGFTGNLFRGKEFGIS